MNPLGYTDAAEVLTDQKNGVCREGCPSQGMDQGTVLPHRSGQERRIHWEEALQAKIGCAEMLPRWRNRPSTE